MTRAELNVQPPGAEKSLLLKLLWLYPVVFLLHDAEEILWIKPFLNAHKNEAPFNRLPVDRITTGTFAASVGLIFLVILALCLYISKNTGERRPVFRLLAAVLFMNGIAHVLQAIYFTGYTPGVVTSVLLIFPYAYFVWKKDSIKGRILAMYLLAGFVVQIPLALGAVIAGTLLFQS
ncbi:HXXEE domain-containing protein [Fictibacillus sp. S7]|uniref:HXXEE domain-containing protein n=1 Tax=Fictibacillus sp. S7 TaxID=2212476 RepID=UPI00101029FB|nr:HXXEE domain-containing protein [Fictibacillus sp. S7]RXZ00675.1 hypothetical protein DMO16_13885 [Fictibacillus sp. S7]